MVRCEIRTAGNSVIKVVRLPAKPSVGDKITLGGDIHTPNSLEVVSVTMVEGFRSVIVRCSGQILVKKKAAIVRDTYEEIQR